MEGTMPRIETLEQTETYGKFVVEPLDRGYGVTLGNSLRRVMLSSIEGAAITYVKLEGALHEFSRVRGLKEDTTELILNLKGLFVKVVGKAGGDEPRTLRLHKVGPGRVTGADVDFQEGVEVVNPEVYLAELDDSATIDMELTVETGKGYIAPDKQERRQSQPIGVIPVGSAFTPVRKVNYTVEATRVGFKTDYERLTLEITTNGTIKPADAISSAALILDRYFRFFMEFGGIALPPAPGTTVDAPADGGPPVADQRIEELDFSVRTYNCLKKDGILSLRDLVERTEPELMGIRNFGKKSLIEVREKLQELGLSLKGGITVAADDGIEEADLPDTVDEE